MTESSPQTFLITGGLGLLSSYLVPLLLKATGPSTQVIVAARMKRVPHWKDSSKVQLMFGDLRDAKFWTGLPQNITHVFHLAAVIPWKSEEKNKANICTDNLLPLAYLIEYSQNWTTLKQIIFSSSISVYAKTSRPLTENFLKQPVDIYGASKLAGENLLLCLESRGIKVVSLRYSSLYAPEQYPGTVLPVMVKRAIEKKEILVYGDGSRTQDFLHCEDAANANLLAYQKEVQGAFNIGSGRTITMNELAYIISKVFTGGTAKIVHWPEKVQECGYNVDITKARQELSYHPGIHIEDGLKRLKKAMGDEK